MVREDLDHPDWADPLVVTIEDGGTGQPGTLPGKSGTTGGPGSPPERPLKPTPESTGSWETVDEGKIPADSVADSTGPLRVIATTLRKKGTHLFKVHLLDNQGKTIGCGWSPNLARVNELTLDEYIANIDSHVCCERCFKNHTFPTDWQTPALAGGPSLSVGPWAANNAIHNDKSCISKCF